MHKICYVSLGSALEAQLAVSGHWIVHENDVIGQFAIVQNFTMILTQLATFCFKPELILKKRKKKKLFSIQNMLKKIMEIYKRFKRHETLSSIKSFLKFIEYFHYWYWMDRKKTDLILKVRQSRNDFFQANDSSKKRTDEFDFTTMIPRVHTSNEFQLKWRFGTHDNWRN